MKTDLKTLSLTVTDHVHEAMRQLKHHWQLTNLDSVLEKCVLRALGEINMGDEV